MSGPLAGSGLWRVILGLPGLLHWCSQHPGAIATATQPTFFPWVHLWILVAAGDVGGSGILKVGGTRAATHA